MKPQKLALILPVAIVLATPALAIQINWGSPVDSVLRDSFGVPLDETFAVELGYFVETLGVPFEPTASNVDDWSFHWRMFDRAAINPAAGYFTSSASIMTSGGSSNPLAAQGVDFSNKDAYIWINNSKTPGTTSEWLLVRSTSPAAWQFPNKPVACCDDLPPLEWSISDLKTTDVPVYGQQGDVAGAGEHTYDGTPGSITLQTYTFVPEPSATLFAALGGMAFVLRRRRTGGY